MCTVGDDVHIVSTGLPHYGLHYTDSIAGLTFHDKCIFQLTHSRFATLRVRYKNSHTYGSKPWEFWVESMALLGRKPHGFGWEMRAEGWMISPTRLRDSYTYNQSTRRSIRVDSAASRSRLLYPQPLDSATHSGRLGGAFESTRNYKACNPWEIKKGQHSVRALPFFRIYEKSFISLPLLFRRGLL